MDPYFNGLLTEFGKSPGLRHPWNPALSTLPHTLAPLQNSGNPPMKSLIALTVTFVFTIAVGVAGKPSAFATDQAIANAKAAKQPIMLAEQELPFDRYWSKN
jgi:hypothetical protein